MNLLAIDTACSILSVAVARSRQDGSVQCKEDEIFYAEIEAGIKHSELVMDCIDSQMKKASLNPNDLDGVLCMGGPGSFTGLRIGFSIAKGLALSLSVPFAAVPTLDCMAFPYRGRGLILTAIEARKNAWFFSLYKDEKPLLPVSDAAASQIVMEIERHIESKIESKIILTGPGAASLYASLPQELKNNIDPVFENRGYAGELIAIAKKNNLPDNNNTTLLYSGPEYIRKTDAELSLI